MKVTKGKTTFEFTKEEIETIDKCYELFGAIYDEMEVDEIFCEYRDLELKDNVLCFLNDVSAKLNKSTNNTITCE